nr:MBL fold metallo-hydrolase [Anaerolineae bacterium]
MTFESVSFESRFFTLYSVADGVLAAVARRDDGGDFANAGLVDLGESVLAFDSFFLPQSAADLVKAARQVFRKPVSYLVNSHFHSDHVTGNYQFPQGTKIISTLRTRALLVENEGRFSQIPESTARAIIDLEKQVERTIDPRDRQYFNSRLAMYQLLARTAPEIEARHPEMTFDDHLTIYGEARSVELMTFGGGHTDSDGFMLVPDAGILFAGDLALVETHPFMLDGHPAAWRDILTRMKKLDFTVLVPGHGPVGGKTDIDEMSGYFDALDEAAQAVVAEGGYTRSTVLTIPDQYSEWGGRAFEPNVKFLVEKLSQT